jgi:hypothetical protein
LRFENWERLSIDGRRMLSVSALSSAASGAFFYILSVNVLGAPSLGVSALVSVVVLYLVLTTPRRLVESLALDQSKQAPLLAAAAAAAYEASRSRGKTLLALSAMRGCLHKVVLRASREVLLGRGVGEVIRDAGRSVLSPSAESVLLSIERLDPSSEEDEWDERGSKVQTARLADETKAPVFIACCLFTPVLLLLLAVLAHREDPWSLVSIVGMEVVVLDLALGFSAQERRMISG